MNIVRSGLRSIAAAIVAASLVGVFPASAQEVRPPNIVIFLADDAPFGSLSRDVMPNVWNRLVRRGTYFSRFYVENPLCCPSRATILTGLPSAMTGVYSNGEDDVVSVYGGTRAFHENGNETRTIAYDLDGLGYETGLFGKYLNLYPSYAQSVSDPPEAWKPLGWDKWVAFYESNGRYYDYRLNEDGVITFHGSSNRDYSTTLLGKKAVEWVRGLPMDQPFFLFYSPYTPHGPSTPDPRDVGRFDGATFRSPAVKDDLSDKPTYLRQDPQRMNNYAMKLESLYSMDRQVGVIMDAIRDRGELDDTIFVYLSDNGLGWGEHGWTYKLVPYERSVRVPAVIRYDGVVPAGVVDDGLASNADLKWTLLQLAGLSTEGTNIVTSDRTAVFLNNMYFPRYLRGRPSVPSYCGVVTERWKYVVYAPNPYEPSLVRSPFEDELYNLSKDPYELNNLIVTNPGSDLVQRKVERLRERLRPNCILPDVASYNPDWFRAW